MADGIDRIRIGSGTDGIVRLAAHLHGQAFTPHRHDTYGIGLTLSGIQTFRFRGQQWYCLPGQCHILHPDELHDGAAVTDEGFCYRIVHIAPSLIQEALCGHPLPFVANPVIDLKALPLCAVPDIWNIDHELDELARVELVAAITGLLDRAASAGSRSRMSLALPGLQRVRDLIADHPQEQHSMAELECLADLDRWTLARQFRAAFGTSPSRYRTQRQLDRVRLLLGAGASLIEAAMEAGFADQSHMSRQFKRAYGLTPAKWTAALRPNCASQMS